MKKLIVFFLVLVCILSLSACNNFTQEQNKAYSFHGEHEYFTISNGAYFFDNGKEVFDGGILGITQSGVFDEVDSYSTSFYIIKNGVKKNLHAKNVIDLTEGPSKIEGDLGKVSGNSSFGSFVYGDIKAFRESLWFELKTTDFDGEENIYQIQLTVEQM